MITDINELKIGNIYKFKNEEYMFIRTDVEVKWAYFVNLETKEEYSMWYQDTSYVEIKLVKEVEFIPVAKFNFKDIVINKNTGDKFIILSERFKSEKNKFYYVTASLGKNNIYTMTLQEDDLITEDEYKEHLEKELLLKPKAKNILEDEEFEDDDFEDDDFAG